MLTNGEVTVGAAHLLLGPARPATDPADDKLIGQLRGRWGVLAASVRTGAEVAS